MKLLCSVTIVMKKRYALLPPLLETSTLYQSTHLQKCIQLTMNKIPEMKIIFIWILEVNDIEISGHVS